MPNRRPVTKADVGKAVMTVVNCLLILMILLFSLVLTLTLLKGGTFSIFGNSWHYYQSDVMSGEVERNELLIINKDMPDTFQPDDLVAFYATDAKGTRVIQIARLISVSDNYYEVTEATGDPFILDSTDTVFIGKVEMHSKLLGHLVQQMRTKEGRQIFLGWSVALLLFSCGLTILLHVRSDRRLQQLQADAVGYPDNDYDEYGYDDDYDDDSDEDYPQPEGVQIDQVARDRFPLYTPGEGYTYDEQDEMEYDEADELPTEVDEENMNLIAASTESEEEEDADFDAIFREIKRQIKKEE